MIQDTIRTRLLHSRRDGDRDGKNIFSFLLGELDREHQQPVTDATCLRIMKGFIKEAGRNPLATFTPREISLLEDLVPPSLDHAACRAYLDTCGASPKVRDVPKEGMAMGIAMKAFSSGKQTVDSDIVRAVIEEIRKGDP